MHLRSLLALALTLAFVPLPARAQVDPVLAVYDLVGQGAVPATVGRQFAAAIAGEVRADGGVRVVTGAPGLPPARDPADARAQGADYYLGGAIAQVGTRYSVILELIRVRTGLLVWSSTLQVDGVDGLHGQGTLARQALFDQIGRSSFPVLHGTPEPATSPSPALASSAAAAPAARFAVVTFGGSALPADRALALQSALETIRARGATAVADSLAPQDLSVSGAQACEDTNAATIVGGTLDTTRPEDPSAAPVANAAVAVQVYDCRTQRLYGKPLAFAKSAPISSDAIRSATAAAVNAYFGAGPPPATR